MSKIKIASLQLNVLEDKYDNIERLAEIIADGAADGADIISLGEIWNSPYQTDLFPVNAEPEQGDSWLAMSTIARKNHVYVVGGSIPELGEDGNIYNTCFVSSPNFGYACAMSMSILVMVAVLSFIQMKVGDKRD